MSSSSIGTGDIYYDEKLWLSIDEMPIWNWNKIIETGDLGFLFKKREKKHPTTNKMSELWQNLQQQHLEEFGMDNSLLSRIKTMRKVVALNIKYYETKDRSLLNLITIENKRIENSSSIAKSRFYKVLDFVTTHKKFQINPRTFTVVEWYYALKNMELQNGKANKG